MAVQAELEVLISVSKQAKTIIDGLLKDLKGVAATLDNAGERSVSTKSADSLTEIADAAKSADLAIKELPESTQKADTAFNELAGGVKVLVGAFVALQSVQIAQRLATVAARTETLGVILGQVANTAGVTATEIQRVDEEVQALGITASASRQSLSQFLQSGLDVGQASELARLAQNAAQIAGSNSSDTFQRLIVNIQQLDTVGLRFMGIVINSEDAMKSYAETIGKSVGQFTQLEKQTAFLNAVFERGVDIAGVYEASMDTVGKQVSSLDRLHEDLAVVVGSTLLPAYGALVEEFTKFLKFAGGAADEFDEQISSGEKLGEIVGQTAQTLRIFLELLIDNKEAIAALGIALLVAKLVALAPLLAGAAAGFAALKAAALALLVTFGGIPGAIIGITSGLVAFFATTRTGGIVLSALQDNFDNLVELGMLPFTRASISIAGGWSAFLAVINGEGLGGITKALNGANAELEALDERIKGVGPQLVASIKGAVEEINKSPVSGVSLSSVEEVTQALSEQIVKVGELQEEFLTLREAGKDDAANAVRDALKEERVQGAALIATIERFKATGKLTDAQLELVAAVEKQRAAVGIAAKTWKEWTDAVSRANRELKLDDLRFKDGSIFSADSQVALSAFGIFYAATLKDLDDNTEFTVESMNKLQRAFRTLTATASTFDDIAQIGDVLETVAERGALSAGVLLKFRQDFAIASNRVAAQERGRFSALVAERKALNESAFKISLANIKAAQSAEIAALRGSIAEQEALYKRGQLSIKDFFEVRRSEAERSAELEVGILKAQLENVNNQINVGGLKQTEINNLVARRATLEGQVAVKVLETTNAINALDREQEQAIRETGILLAETREKLFSALGEGARAAKLAIERELGETLIEIKPSENSEEIIASLREVARIKTVIIGLDQESAVLNINRNQVEAEQANLQQQLLIGTIDQFEFEKRSRGLADERVRIALQELDILRRQSAEQKDNVILQAEVVNKQREVRDLQTRALTEFRSVANDINQIFASTASTFIKELVNGTLTWQELFTNVLSNISNQLLDLATNQLVQTLFRPGGGADIGGAIPGAGGGGGDGGFLSNIVGDIGNLFGDIFGGGQGGGLSSGGGNARSGGGGQCSEGLLDEFTNTCIPKFEEVVAGGFVGVVDSLSDTADGGGFGFSNLLTSLTGGFSGMIDSVVSVVSGLFSDSGSGGGIGGIISGIVGIAGSFFGGGAGGGAAFADGGLITGPGSGTSDSIPARVSNGEFIVRASETGKYLPLLNMINEGKLAGMTPSVRVPNHARFAEGGLVNTAVIGSPEERQQANSDSNVRIVNVVDPAITKDFLASSEGEKVILNVISRNNSALKQALA